MQRILLSFIGDRDPVDFNFLDNTNAFIWEPGPILETLEIIETNQDWSESKPDSIFLYYFDDGKSYKRVQERADSLKEILSPRYNIHTKQLYLENNDVSDYTALMKSVSVEVFNLNKNYSNAEFLILVSPGTPQMQACWIALGNEAALKNAIYIQKREGRKKYATKTDYPPRELHEVVSREPGEIKYINFSPIFENEVIEVINELLSRFDFLGASSMTSKFGSSYKSYRKENEDFLSRFYNSLHLWAVLDYEKAYVQMKDVKIPPHINEGAISVMKKYLPDILQTLGSLADNDSQTKVIDMYWSASRSLENSSYTECIWRCNTAYEIMLSRELMSLKIDTEKYKIERVNLMEDILLLNIENIQKSKLISESEVRQHISSAHLGMSRINHPISQYTDKKGNIRYVSIRTKIGNTREYRNKLVHKGVKCTEPQSINALRNLKNAIEYFYNNDSIIDNYFMSIENIKKINQEVISEFT